MVELMQVAEFLLEMIAIAIIGVAVLVIGRIVLGLGCGWVYEHVVRPAIQVKCSVFIKPENPAGLSRGDYAGTFWLPSVPRIGEKVIVPMLKNPHDQTTHVMNGWLGGRVNKVEYAVEGGVPWHANVHVDCDGVAPWA